jgi:hypothetical protein
MCTHKCSGEWNRVKLTRELWRPATRNNRWFENPKFVPFFSWSWSNGRLKTYRNKTIQKKNQTIPCIYQSSMNTPKFHSFTFKLSHSLFFYKLTLLTSISWPLYYVSGTWEALTALLKSEIIWAVKTIGWTAPILTASSSHLCFAGNNYIRSRKIRQERQVGKWGEECRFYKMCKTVPILRTP